jgi:uncharacterized protein (DUF983 family)
MTEQTLHGQLPIGRGLRGRCPRCGEGRLFQGFLSLRPTCEHCGLDYSFADSGDGSGCVCDLDCGLQYWLHAALWLPLILFVTLAPLRLIKGLLIALQYHHKAAEGRLDRRGEM